EARNVIARKGWESDGGGVRRCAGKNLHHGQKLGYFYSALHRRERGGEKLAEKNDDPQACLRQIPALFEQENSQDRQAPQLGHVQDARGGGEAREGRAVLQAALIDGCSEEPKINFITY